MPERPTVCLPSYGISDDLPDDQLPPRRSGNEPVDVQPNVAVGRRAPGRAKQRSSGGVQSIERAFTILEALAGNGGVMGLSALAAASGLPLPTIHRLARTLVDLGYLRQEPSRQYALGPRILLLAESSSTMLSVVARPHLARLVDELGETANLASLDGDQIVYISQVPSRHSMRMFTEVGRRVLPHCTAVGKAIMADMPPEEVRESVAPHRDAPAHRAHHHRSRRSSPSSCAGRPNTATRSTTASRNSGVRCVAVAVPGVRRTWPSRFPGRPAG